MGIAEREAIMRLQPSCRLMQPSCTPKMQPRLHLPLARVRDMHARAQGRRRLGCMYV